MRLGRVSKGQQPWAVLQGCCHCCAESISVGIIAAPHPPSLAASSCATAVPLQRLLAAGQQGGHDAALGRQLRQAVACLPRAPDGFVGGWRMGDRGKRVGGGARQLSMCGWFAQPSPARCMRSQRYCPPAWCHVRSHPAACRLPCAAPSPSALPPFALCARTLRAQWRTTTAPAPSACTTCCSCTTSPACRWSLTSTTTRQAAPVLCCWHGSCWVGLCGCAERVC